MQAASGIDGRPGRPWREALLRTIYQHPLIETAPSLSGVDGSTTTRPNTIFVGFGLCSHRRLTAGVPIGVLAMLLPAEAVRRAVGARSIVALIADRHAMIGFPAEAVRERAAWYERVLRRTREHLPLERLEILRASSFHDDPEYIARLELVTDRAGDAGSEYLTRQITDVDYLQQRVGPLLKVGWCLSKRCGDVKTLHDERGFDAWVEPYTAHRIPYVYTKPGRVLDDRRRKAAPYVVHDPSKRVCFQSDEPLKQKLERASRRISKETYRGVYRHLAAIAKSYADLTGNDSDGALDRLEALIDKLAA